MLGDDIDVPDAPDALSPGSERFPHYPFDPVALNGVADLLGNRYPQPGGRTGSDAVQREKIGVVELLPFPGQADKLGAGAQAILFGKFKSFSPLIAPHVCRVMPLGSLQRQAFPASGPAPVDDFAAAFGGHSF
jgi:hypothetical protein